MCGKARGTFSLLSSQTRCPECQSKKNRLLEADIDETRRKYQVEVAQFESTLRSAWEALKSSSNDPTIPDINTSIAPVDCRRIEETALYDFVSELVADDVLSTEEEARLAKIAAVLHIDWARFDQDHPSVWRKILLGRLSDSRLLNPLPEPKVILKKNEVAYGEATASLMKEQAVREWQSGYAGVSFRVMKGVKFNTGGSRGRMVTVTTEMVADDAGLLTVTSNRIIFTGQRRSLDIPLTKLLSLDMYSDGVRIHSSNRKNAPLFRLADGEMVSALINVVAQKSL